MPNRDNSDTEKRDLGLPLAILIVSALAGIIAIGTIDKNDYSASYLGVLFGLLIGLGVILTVQYASIMIRRKSVMLLLISMMIVGAFSIAVPVHADTAIVTQFGVGNQQNTEPCQSLTVGANNFNGYQQMNVCAGLAATVYKDISEQDSVHDDYLLEMAVFAMNGTNGSCFLHALFCNYPITATSIYNARIGISGTTSALNANGFNPGSGCSNTQSPVSYSFSGV